MIVERLRGVAAVCRQIFGIPDYERYLRHMRTRHPQAPVLSERDYHANATDRKYGRNGSRCC
jgi:uncharacterized short protein YbdD (DUF466 family)